MAKKLKQKKLSDDKLISWLANTLFNIYLINLKEKTDERTN